MANLVLQAASCRIYINNRVYKEAQTVSYSLDYAETEIFGIDSVYPQEIATTRATCSGSIQGIRIKYSGGIQGYNARPQFKDIMSAPYISIRIQDRASGEDLIFIPNAKISQQSYSIPAKGIVRLNFSFKGLIALEPLDRISS